MLRKEDWMEIKEQAEKGTFYSGEKWTKQIGVDTIHALTLSRNSMLDTGCLRCCASLRLTPHEFSPLSPDAFRLTADGCKLMAVCCLLKTVDTVGSSCYFFNYHHT